MKRLGTSFGSAEPQEPYPLPCLNLITLITYQFSLLLFVCLACPWPALVLRTLAQHHLAARLLAYQHTWLSLFFDFTLLSHQSKVFSPKFFYSSPPWVLSSTFHFPLPFSPSWLPSASLLLCLLALCVASVVCGRTGELDWRSVWT